MITNFEKKKIRFQVEKVCLFFPNIYSIVRSIRHIFLRRKAIKQSDRNKMLHSDRSNHHIQNQMASQVTILSTGSLCSQILQVQSLKLLVLNDKTPMPSIVMSFSIGWPRAPGCSAARVMSTQGSPSFLDNRCSCRRGWRGLEAFCCHLPSW